MVDSMVDSVYILKRGEVSYCMPRALLKEEG